MAHPKKQRSRNSSANQRKLRLTKPNWVQLVGTLQMFALCLAYTAAQHNGADQAGNDARNASGTTAGTGDARNSLLLRVVMYRQLLVRAARDRCIA